MPVDFEIENFSLEIILFNQKLCLIVSLKHPKNLPLGAGFLLRKRIFLIEKINDSTVNPSAFNYCQQSKIKMISKPSTTL